MGYTCETCGKAMQSNGSLGLHQITVHAPGSAAPGVTGYANGPSAGPPPQAPGAYGQYPDPHGRYGRPQRQSHPVVIAVGAVVFGVALLFVGSIVAISFLGTESKTSTRSWARRRRQVNEEHVHLPAGDALKVTVVIPQGPLNVLVVQHVLVRDSDVWVLTNTQDSRGEATLATTVASTFGWTK